MRARRERLAWALLAAVLAVVLAFGSFGRADPPTAQDRVVSLSESITCPTCAGESVADSNAEMSRAVRRDLADRVSAGQTDEQILAYYVSVYGEGVLLNPAATGPTAVVWVLPVVVASAAVAGLVVVFRRWSRDPARRATDEDRALVAEALARGDDRWEP